MSADDRLATRAIVPAILRDGAVARGPVPQVRIEFDVAAAAAVGPAARELEQYGYELVHPPRQEPWDQTVARLQ